MGIVLVPQLKLDTAQRVDLVDSDLRTVFNGVAVNRRAAGQRAAAADLKHGSVGFGAVVLAAAGEDNEQHRHGEEHRKHFFHFLFSPFTSNEYHTALVRKNDGGMLRKCAIVACKKNLLYYTVLKRKSQLKIYTKDLKKAVSYRAK